MGQLAACLRKPALGKYKAKKEQNRTRHVSISKRVTPGGVERRAEEQLTERVSAGNRGLEVDGLTSAN